MAFSDSEEKFKIVEVDVFEDEASAMDAQGYDMESQVSIADQQEDTSTKTRQRERTGSKPKAPKNKFGWAFFLASLFIGLGITATTGHPMPLFAGMGIGFLFFVDPIYHKLMEKIDRL
ncbi:MAG: hypothetical protein OHK0039_22360 [Bacteroidia bacterium]